jgi:hypothetical protein
MVDAKNETMREIINAIYSSMANQMALAKAIATGKRASPAEFYNPKIKKKQPRGINRDGFAAMKAAFVKE